MQPTGRETHGGGQDDFFNQMLSTLPAAWTELVSAGKSPWELPPDFDDSALRHHQIGGGDKPVMLHLSDLHGEDGANNAGFLPLPLLTDRSREGMDAAVRVFVRSRCSAAACLASFEAFHFFHLL
jgi:hypothetical protein